MHVLELQDALVDGNISQNVSKDEFLPERKNNSLKTETGEIDLEKKVKLRHKMKVQKQAASLKYGFCKK